MAKTTTPPYMTMFQFIVSAVTTELSGKKEKNQTTKRNPKAMQLM
jgi:hypothetical protein